jgi:PA14 domain
VLIHPPWKLVLNASKVLAMKRSALVGCLLFSTACQVQMRAESSLGGSGSSTSSSPAKPASKPKASSHAGHGRGVSVSFHKEGSISGKLDWQGRSGNLCRAVSPFKFVGTAQLAGTARLTPSGIKASGNADASGTTSGGVSGPNTCSPPRTHVPATPAPKPVTHPATGEPLPPKTKPNASDIGRAPPVNPSPVRGKPTLKPGGISRSAKPDAKPEQTPTPEPTPTPTTPTPTELEKPQDPPAEPPSNVFGYDTPVLGCFEGQVFPLATDTQKLPTSYESQKPVSVVYACEWDIAPRAWDQGFPGIADRFEWFAIRYAGAFRTSQAGEYAFRLSSDDGSKLIIDGKVVIDNDTQHPPREARGSVQLAAGDHQMVLEYFQGPRFYINLQLWVTPPGKPEELFTVR